MRGEASYSELPAPRCEEDGVGHFDRSNARALIVREGEDVIRSSLASPEGVLLLDPSKGLGVVLIYPHRRRLSPSKTILESRRRRLRR